MQTHANKCPRTSTHAYIVHHRKKCANNSKQVCIHACVRVCERASAHTAQRATSRTHALITHARWHARTHARSHVRTHARTHVRVVRTDVWTDGRTDGHSFAPTLACLHASTSSSQPAAHDICTVVFDVVSVCDATFHEIDHGRAWKPLSSSFDCYLRPSRDHESLHGRVMGDVAKI
jgi:hypothetical protein